MYGVVTRNEPELDWSEFDRAFYEVKDVTGRAVEPVAEAVNMVSCFGDTAAGEAKPDLVPVSDEGEKATRERTYFDWGYICPSRERYREGLLEMIEDCAAVNGDIRLDDVGFPRQEYCYCEHCNEAFEQSEYEDRFDWRASVITEFVAEATERIPGKTYFTLYPDPYPGHLYERAGLDLDALAEYVDEFVVPLYDMAYSTTYWLEVIASGFQDALSKPFSIELYAVDVDLDNLIHATEVADAYAEDVYFGYDASQASAAIRRMKADSQDGKSFGDFE
ncbi:hypothetical protein [Haloarchaeobius sp. HME9146]|uniref:hypothetical protein n=1 Tax=Haloarchaeobius sp. HME9146 TaxID=2978732 RepID=UPI0021C0798D|nr:hypothetical protein [Haloarchaeobius sp. HME9146]MCT9096902.1 hypothetical protein [Haloarchaeobius sp. HME9146]